MKALVVNYIAVLKHLRFEKLMLLRPWYLSTVDLGLRVAQLKQPDVQVVSVVQITCIFMTVNCIP